MIRSRKASVRQALWTGNEMKSPRVTRRQCNVLPLKNHPPTQLTGAGEATLNPNANNMGLFEDVTILLNRKSDS